MKADRLRKDVGRLMEKILFVPEDGEEPVEFYVLEETTVGGINYFLVTDTKDGDGEALIMKDLSAKEDEEAVFEIVTDDHEMDAVAAIFENLMEDVTLKNE